MTDTMLVIVKNTHGAMNVLIANSTVEAETVADKFHTFPDTDRVAVVALSAVVDW
jgi:hypothetical protein